MAEFLGAETMPRTQVVKRIWAYIKEHELQDPKNRRRILLDDKLKTLFTPPLDMFSMNKQLSKHVYTAEASAGGSSRPRAKPKPKAEKRAAGEGKQQRGKKAKKEGARRPGPGPWLALAGPGWPRPAWRLPAGCRMALAMRARLRAGAGQQPGGRPAAHCCPRGPCPASLHPRLNRPPQAPRPTTRSCGRCCCRRSWQPLWARPPWLAAR
jgi:upstream activation factor subunit UAF30